MYHRNYRWYKSDNGGYYQRTRECRRTSSIQFYAGRPRISSCFLRRAPRISPGTVWSDGRIQYSDTTGRYDRVFRYEYEYKIPLGFIPKHSNHSWIINGDLMVYMNFTGLSVALGTLRTNVDARLETRSKLAGLFASQIGKDIMELIMDVNKLRDQVVVRSSCSVCAWYLNYKIYFVKLFDWKWVTSLINYLNSP